MGIDKYHHALSEHFLSAHMQSLYSVSFNNVLSTGVVRMCIHMFGKVNLKNSPDYVSLWKVPTCHNSQHTGKVAQSISSCPKVSPKKMASEAICHFNAIVGQMFEIPSDARNALSS